MALVPSVFRFKLPSLMRFGLLLAFAGQAWACAPQPAGEPAPTSAAAQRPAEIAETVDEPDDEGVFPRGLTTRVSAGLALAVAHLPFNPIAFDPPPLHPPPQAPVIRWKRCRFYSMHHSLSL